LGGGRSAPAYVSLPFDENKSAYNTLQIQIITQMTSSAKNSVTTNMQRQKRADYKPNLQILLPFCQFWEEVAPLPHTSHYRSTKTNRLIILYKIQIIKQMTSSAKKFGNNKYAETKESRLKNKIYRFCSLSASSGRRSLRSRIRLTTVRRKPITR